MGLRHPRKKERKTSALRASQSQDCDSMALPSCWNEHPGPIWCLTYPSWGVPQRRGFPQGPWRKNLPTWFLKKLFPWRKVLRCSQRRRHLLEEVRRGARTWKDPCILKLSLQLSLTLACILKLKCPVWVSIHAQQNGHGIIRAAADTTLWVPERGVQGASQYWCARDPCASTKIQNSRSGMWQLPYGRSHVHFAERKQEPIPGISISRILGMGSHAKMPGIMRWYGIQNALVFYLIFFVVIKPEKPYSASSWEGSKPPGSDHTRAESQTTCIPKTVVQTTYVSIYG